MSPPQLLMTVLKTETPQQMHVSGKHRGENQGKSRKKNRLSKNTTNSRYVAKQIFGPIPLELWFHLHMVHIGVGEILFWAFDRYSDKEPFL